MYLAMTLGNTECLAKTGEGRHNRTLRRPDLQASIYVCHLSTHGDLATQRRRMDIEANAATVQHTTQLVISTPDAAVTSHRESVAAPNSGQLRDRRAAQSARVITPKGVENQVKGQNRKQAYFARRREQTGKDYCVLLAWKAGSQAFVVDIPVADPDNEEAVFTEINAQYYARRGIWRKRLGLCDVEGVERVEVSPRPSPHVDKSH